jgi:alpha-L-fucosidase
VKHLTELLSNYGKIDFIIFDGYRCVDFPHNFKDIAETLRRLQPEIVLANGYTRDTLIFIEGEPDVRWIGNEEGIVNDNFQYKFLCRGKDEPESALTERDLIPDCYVRLGNRQWFYLEKGMGSYKTVETLVDLYKNSYMKGTGLILNVSPDKTGHIPEIEIQLLNGLNEAICLLPYR